MGRSFIFFGCLFSVVLLQTTPLSACGCGKKRHRHFELQFKELNTSRPVGGGCGCGGNKGGVKRNVDNIPAAPE